MVRSTNSGISFARCIEMNSVKIIAAFDAAAENYDQQANLQREVARHLLDLIKDDCKPRTILELGCGTGILTELLALHWPEAEITALDASPKMLTELQGRLPQVHAILGEAENFRSQQTYDLVISSMMLHWLPQPNHVLRSWQELAKPQGRLAIALPVAGSLSEWQTLCQKAGAAEGVWNFPDAECLNTAGLLEIKSHIQNYASPYDFLRSLQLTGAHTPRPEHRPLSAGRLREILQSAKGAFSVTYQIGYYLSAGKVGVAAARKHKN
jgi:malonyl-ACP O-methyltransferase BioC